MERQRGNERERDPPPPPSLFNSSLHFPSLSPYRETLATSPLSLPLFPLFLSTIHPISDASIARFTAFDANMKKVEHTLSEKTRPSKMEVYHRDCRNIIGHN